jgi:hypothetical protein
MLNGYPQVLELKSKFLFKNWNAPQASSWLKQIYREAVEFLARTCVGIDNRNHAAIGQRRRRR